MNSMSGILLIIMHPTTFIPIVKIKKLVDSPGDHEQVKGEFG